MRRLLWTYVIRFMVRAKSSLMSWMILGVALLTAWSAHEPGTLLCLKDTSPTRRKIPAIRLGGNSHTPSAMESTRSSRSSVASVSRLRNKSIKLRVQGLGSRI